MGWQAVERKLEFYEVVCVRTLHSLHKAPTWRQQAHERLSILLLSALRRSFVSCLETVLRIDAPDLPERAC